MRARLMKLGAAVAALAALAVGGSALAQAGGSGPQPVKPAAAVEQGSAKADTDSIQDESGKDDATEQAGAKESESAVESAESSSEQPGDDGQGGWADEPGNPNADTQQQGEH